jgi:nucleotide-binding universal stress UspA family protein
MLPIRTVFYPTDFSEQAEPAFEFACALARDYGARMVIAHVSPPLIQVVGDGGFVNYPAGNVDTLMERLKTVRPADSRLSVEYKLVEGDAADEITRMAQEAKADVIVMGTHGRGGLSRLLLGSVAESVMRLSTCPVLTVKTPLAAAPAAPAPKPSRVDVSIE